MNFALTPRYKEVYPLDGLTIQQFLVLAVESFHQLQWDITRQSATYLVAEALGGEGNLNTRLHVRLHEGSVDLLCERIDTVLFDNGRCAKTLKSFIQSVNAGRTNLTPEELDQRYIDLADTLQEDETLAETGDMPGTRSGQNFLSIFVPTRSFMITPILIDLNILIFIFMLFSGAHIFSPSAEILLNWGANFRPSTLNGEWWRLITNCFLHIGILHLALNMYALLYIGAFLEPLIGKTKFIIAYLLGGIAASAASLWWNEFTISAGASGAIFCMYGLFFALLTTNLIEKESRNAMLSSIGVFIVANLVIGMQDGIDAAAHIGGLLVGCIFGYIIVLSLKRPAHKGLHLGSLGLMGMIVLAACTYVAGNTSNDTVEYDRRMATFAELEAEALRVFELPENTSTGVILYQLEENGINNWKECREIIESLSQLDLPDELMDQQESLIKYCDLRIRVNELLIKNIEEDTDAYNAEIEECNNALNQLLISLQE